MTTQEVLLVPAAVRRFVENLSGEYGKFTLRWSEPAQCGAIIAASAGNADLTPFPVQDHFLQFADSGPAGRWFVGTAEHVGIWRDAAGRGGAIPIREMRDRLPGVLFQVGSRLKYYAIIVSKLNDVPPIWTGWIVTSDEVTPMQIDVERDDEGLSTLGSRWPLDSLRQSHVAVIGVGSIGSAAATSLADHGVGSLTLIDPDRLEFHNLVRHQLGRADVGKYKAPALADAIRQSHPTTSINATKDDVVWNTEAVRSALRDVDVVVGATDGVVPRRTIIHTARRLKKTVLLACVLMDGALGEIMRFRPVSSHGCLECRRRTHPDLFTLDDSLEMPYGTGTDHLPMTAVGTDLELVGRLLSKATVATILEPVGMADQRLAGETAIVGLRPTGNAPAPYDVTRTGEVRWLPAEPPQPGCPTCDPPV
ncbi:HesA/MoeB/ThiF family protein [Nesterenkonia sp. CF4.4]|uniref:HesA/MoeB/ThiF family protein n=1 Tax=Nesterenkonia sp. CF4.4 TaxID=3373079 RepID=UPI003EE7A1E6